MNVVIVGAGSAGIFAALELLKHSEISITLIDKAPVIGGAGLQSDGKLMFSYKGVGTQDLTRFVDANEAQSIIDEVEIFFGKYNIHASSPPKDIITKFSKECLDLDVSYTPTRQAHIGSDVLQSIMRDISSHLESRLTLLTRTEVVDIQRDAVIVKSQYSPMQHTIPYDHLIIAVGRTGGLAFKSIYDKLGVDYSFSPIDIGVRVEVPASSTKKIVEDYGIWDVKLSLTTSRDERIRTFCTCPYGFIRLENYGMFNDRPLIGVNGYSNAHNRCTNSNFAVLNTVHLTKPFEDTTLLGQNTVWAANLLGGGHPLVQRYADLLNDKRTTPERLSRSRITSTLSSSYTVGDISFAYNGRVIQNIREGLERLSDIIPLPPEDTLLYAPEVKFYARQVEFNGGFKTRIENISIVGDGSGISRGIVGAAATGIIAARQILRDK